MTPTTSHYYKGINQFYRWFRQDGLTRKCVLINAYFATMTTGFETVLKTTSDYINQEDYAFIKECIDEFNKQVNMDRAGRGFWFAWRMMMVSTMDFTAEPSRRPRSSRIFALWPIHRSFGDPLGFSCSAMRLLVLTGATKTLSRSTIVAPCCNRT